MSGFLGTGNFSFFTGRATAATPVFVAGYYGSFYDTTIQTATAINTPTAVKLNSTDLTATNGISIANDTLGNPTRITAAHTGLYNLQFSAQLQRSSGGSSQQLDFWIRVNNANVSNTNTHVNVQANAGYLVTAWNFFVYLTVGQYVQLMWATSATTIQLYYDAANLTVPYPATPSVILTMQQVA
jgi:hypothetical protein